jgi:pimeloyl-ACP methyl ester carboxylesterase
MRREIALPTPLHAADLQFQAFAEFDGSNALAAIRCPIMLLTGDLDELIPPQNSVLMAKLVPGAKLIVIPGAGHRVLWEATQVCVDLIIAFLNFDSDGSILVQRDVVQRQMPAAPHPMMSAIELFTTWPLIFAETGFEAMAIARQALMSASRFGDGKPIILVPGFLGSDLALLPLSLWLEALGYRPVMADLFINLEGSHAENSLSRAIREATQRLGRKAVLITHSSVITGALRTAVAHRELISDVVIFEARHGPNVAGVRTHYLSSRWSFVHGIIELPRLLRNIGIELLEGSTSEISGVATRSIDQTIAKEERK